MPTDKQIKSNRENARRSTGPTTPAGKTRAASNSIRHGLLARHAVIRIEDRPQYLELLAGLDAEFQPEGLTESYFVEQMASARWRLARLTRIETGFINTRIDQVIDLESAAYEGEEDEDEEEQEEQQPEPVLTPEQQDRENTRLLGLSFARNNGGDPFAKLARYEGVLQRTFYRAYRALLDAQSRRTPPPQNIAEPNEPKLPLTPSPSMPTPTESPKASAPPAGTKPAAGNGTASRVEHPAKVLNSAPVAEGDNGSSIEGSSAVREST
jgi:hypothetical protein